MKTLKRDIKCCKTINKFMKKLRNELQTFTSLSTGGSPPASTSKTFQSLFSVNLLAKTLPADPAPTIMKSYSSKPKIDCLISFLQSNGLATNLYRELLVRNPLANGRLQTKRIALPSKFAQEAQKVHLQLQRYLQNNAAAKTPFSTIN
jgi:hypothetical protein